MDKIMSDFKVSDILLSKGNARSIIDIDELSVEELDKIIKRETKLKRIYTRIILIDYAIRMYPKSSFHI